jgi:hypothetical protein
MRLGILSTRKPLQSTKRRVLPMRGREAVPLLWLAAAGVLFLSPAGSTLGFLAALATTVALALLFGARPPRGGERTLRQRAVELGRRLAALRASRTGLSGLADRVV